MKILVTGGTGFVGSHLCERLVHEGHTVRSLVRDPSHASFLEQLGIEIAHGDLKDADSLDRAVRGIDEIYHFAAYFRRNNLSRKEIWQTNVKGTQHLLDASVKYGIKRFIHCSSVGVHGGIEGPPATEDSPFSPSDDYQRSKLEAEQIVMKFMCEERLPIVIIRPGGLYGPRDRRFGKLFRAVKHQYFIMVGNGESRYQFIYIDDLIDGIMLCSSPDDALGETYILTGEQSITLNALLITLSKVLEVPVPRLRVPFAPVYAVATAVEFVCKPLRIHPPLFRRRVNFFRKSRAFDISKIKQQLGFKPRVDLETGLARTAQWYEQNKML